MPASSPLKLLLLVSLPLYLLDQVTKWLVVAYVSDPKPVLPGWFDLVYLTNTGAAWGMFQNGNAGFLVLSAAALAALGFLWRRGAFETRLARVGFSLLAAGILGNLTDRIARQHVVDFLSFDLHIPGANPWPAFNVADSCICVAVTAFLAGCWHDLRRPSGGR
jgi:signal peptidase II